MGIRKYKPTTPGRRGASVSDFAEITRSTPEKSLIRPLHGKGGRNAHGKVTTRHQGGGHKRAYRLIDFRRNDKDGIPARVAHIEYDPNRTSRIALLHYADGEKRYIIAPARLKQGDKVEAGPKADIKVGNNLPQVHILWPDQLNTYDVLYSDVVLFTSAALETFLAGPIAVEPRTKEAAK